VIVDSKDEERKKKRASGRTTPWPMFVDVVVLAVQGSAPRRGPDALLSDVMSLW